MKNKMFKNILFTIFCLGSIAISLTQSAAGQNARLSEDLNQNFSHYELVRFQPKAVFENIQNKVSFELRTDENNFNIQ